MPRLPILLVLLIVAACDSPPATVAPISPSVVTPSASAPYPNPTLPVGEALSIGKELSGRFIGNPLSYEVTPPSGGTLVVRLSWDPTSQFSARFLMVIGECAVPTWFPVQCPSAVVFRSSAPDWSPLVGRVTIAAGQTYRVVIDEGVAPWDYGFNQPFTLTADLER